MRMIRKPGVETESKTLNVLVADSTLLTGNLIADALRRDRKLSVANATSDSVVAAVSSWLPHVVILSEALEGTPGRGFEVLIGNTGCHARNSSGHAPGFRAA